MTSEMILELILELISDMILELTSDQAEISDPDGCPLTWCSIGNCNICRIYSCGFQSMDVCVIAGIEIGRCME